MFIIALSSLIIIIWLPQIIIIIFLGKYISIFLNTRMKPTHYIHVKSFEYVSWYVYI